jgi:hypothetical protein
MSSLGPDRGSIELALLSGEAESTDRSSLTPLGDRAAATSLWSAFRDRYTQPKERYQLNESGAWVEHEESSACPLPLYPWGCQHE